MRALALAMLLIAAPAAADQVAIRPADPAPPSAERVGSVPLAPPADPHAAHAAAPTAHGADHGGGHHEDPTKYFNWTGGIPFGYKSLDKAGGPMGDGKVGVGEHAVAVPPGEKEPGMSAPFIGMLFNFFLLVGLLVWKAGPLAQKAARERSEQIGNALDEAAKLRAAAQKKLDEYGAKLAAADDEITKMVAGMRADAEAEKARVLAAADAQVLAMKRDADERIAAEIARARSLLTREVALAASRAAEQLVRERATAADQARLVDSFIADLGKQPAAGQEVR